MANTKPNRSSGGEGAGRGVRSAGAEAMSGRKRSLDTEAAQYVVLAKRQARIKGISVQKAFGTVTKSIPRVLAQHRSRLFDPAEFTTPETVLDARHREGRLRTLRFDLEAALLRFDACCPVVGRGTEWLGRDESKALDTLVDHTTDLIARQTLLTPWKCFQRIDRHFPKLGLCRRVTGYVTRIAASTPPRPLGALMSPSGFESEPFTQKFFRLLLASRRGGIPTEVVWTEFVPMILRCKNAERLKSGKSPWSILLRESGMPSGTPEMEAYVAFLELDRADLLWGSHHGRRLQHLQVWLSTLGNLELLEKLAPFMAGPVSLMASLIEQFKGAEVKWKRGQDKARKAKSRKKLGQ